MSLIDKNRNKALSSLKTEGEVSSETIQSQFSHGNLDSNSIIDSADGQPLHYLTLMEASKLIKSRKITSTKLTQIMLDRINEVDKKLHSYATVMVEHALEKANIADQKISLNEYLGPLHGIPIAVKDMFYTKGVRTMGGLEVMKDFVPDYNATVVSKLEAAGAIILGKLNLAEGALPGYHRNFDIPINPWGEKLWAGASSSGSGVATAAGLCFASLGTDTGGSIRFPSMANGVVGLKPTYGSVSRHGLIPLAQSLDHVGPMGRRTADVALVFQAIAGKDPNDPTSRAKPVPNMLQDLNLGVQGLRIGFDRNYSTEGMDPILIASINTAIEQLESMGAVIVDVIMPELPNILNYIMSYEGYSYHSKIYATQAEEYGDFINQFLAFGKGVTAMDYRKANKVRADYSSRFNAMLSDVDAAITPAGGIPFDISPEANYGGMTSLGNALKADFRFTFPANLTGTPTLSLRCGFSNDGLPLTMQLWGKKFSESTLCRIGHTYEEATGWYKKHPAI